MNLRRIVFNVLTIAIPLFAYGTPLLIVSAPAFLWPYPLVLGISVLTAPVAYGILFVLISGLLSCPFQSAIIPGRFPRDLGESIYARRRLYGLCWTLVYYCKPVYAGWLAVPALKRLLFRLFGYRGPTDFTVYPDTWIRDLPLLHFGSGVYVANRATLATNIALRNRSILVDRIRLDDGATVGHLSMLAPGVWVRSNAEVGAGSAIGVRCDIGVRALVQPLCTINHHARIGDSAVIGTMSYVGISARIDRGASLEPCSRVVKGARVTKQDANARAATRDTAEPLLKLEV